MDQLPEYPAFRYQHAGFGKISRFRLILSLLILLSAFLVFLVLPPLAVVPIIVGLLFLLLRNKYLYLAPRYLLCGTDIVYYANVTKLVLSEMNGTLRLQTVSGKDFILEREKFPTYANKPHKIKRNKEAKFAKVSAKIIDKVRRHAPAVDCIGLSPDA